MLTQNFSPSGSSEKLIVLRSKSGMTKKAIYFFVHERDETLTTRVSCYLRDNFKWNTAEAERIEKR
jgi:hypothetical protein